MGIMKQILNYEELLNVLKVNNNQNLQHMFMKVMHMRVIEVKVIANCFSIRPADISI